MSSLPLVGRRERESLLFTAGELALKTSPRDRCGPALAHPRYRDPVDHLHHHRGDRHVAGSCGSRPSAGSTLPGRLDGRSRGRAVPRRDPDRGGDDLPAAVPIVAVIAWFGASPLALHSVEARSLLPRACRDLMSAAALRARYERPRLAPDGGIPMSRRRLVDPAIRPRGGDRVRPDRPRRRDRRSRRLPAPRADRPWSLATCSPCCH